LRAVVTLYIAISLLHTFHSRVKAMLFNNGRNRLGSLLGIVIIFLFAILDIALVNDMLLLNGDNANSLSALPVQDLYSNNSGPFKIKNKELDTLIISIIQFYRF
jgi:hypothetical protein